MNSLAAWLKANPQVSELNAMNALQTAGVVSDLCVWADEVAECDCARAVAFLESL